MSLQKANGDIYLKGPAVALPARVVDNAALIEWMGAKVRDSWIEHRTGIRERRWVTDDESCSDLATAAAESLFGAYPEERERIRQLIVATISGDYPTPPTSPLVQHRLGLVDVGAFDLGAACAGFVTGLHTACALQAATKQTVLLIASDIRSKFLNKGDLATSALFGDGAAACAVTSDAKGAAFKYIASQLFSDGSVADIISIAAGGSKLPYTRNTDAEKNYLKMKKGAVLFLKAAEGMAESATRFLKAMCLTVPDIDWIVPHQANLHLVREVAKKLDAAAEKVVETVQFTGNTSGASVGVALHHLRQNAPARAGAPLKRGHRILLISAGGGGLAACCLLESR